jgi:putative transposase
VAYGIVGELITLPVAMALLTCLGAFFRSRNDLGFEVAAPRLQLIVLKRKCPRPRLRRTDRIFWVALRRWWSRWSEALIIVQPETVVGWHRVGFRLFWRWRSRAAKFGRPTTTVEISHADPPHGATKSRLAPRIHGELLELGFELSERTVSRYLARLFPNGSAAKRWLAFLKNHREVITGLDFFTVPTLTFRVLYRFFGIAHNRRRILHFNVTDHPTADWVVQQLRETRTAARIGTILDRDDKFNDEVLAMLKSCGAKPMRTSRRSPWQNGIAERWVGSCRRELLDHVIVKPIRADSYAGM